jgi:hypothetical protein
MLFSGGYFRNLERRLLPLRFSVTTGGGAGGRPSTCTWIAKRSLCQRRMKIPHFAG